jgi:hypothetical protein
MRMARLTVNCLTLFLLAGLGACGNPSAEPSKSNEKTDTVVATLDDPASLNLTISGALPSSEPVGIVLRRAPFFADMRATQFTDQMQGRESIKLLGLANQFGMLNFRHSDGRAGWIRSQDVSWDTSLRIVLMERAVAAEQARAARLESEADDLKEMLDVLQEASANNWWQDGASPDST